MQPPQHALAVLPHALAQAQAQADAAAQSVADARLALDAEESVRQRLAANCHTLYKHSGHSAHAAASIRAGVQLFRALRGKVDRRVGELCLYLTDCDELLQYEQKAHHSVAALVATAETRRKEVEIGVDGEGKRLDDDEHVLARWLRAVHRDELQHALADKADGDTVLAETAEAERLRATAAHGEADARERLARLEREMQSASDSERDLQRAAEATEKFAADVRQKRAAVSGVYAAAVERHKDLSERCKLTREVRAKETETRAAAELLKVADTAAATAEAGVKELEAELAKWKTQLDAANVEEQQLRNETAQMRSAVERELPRLRMSSVDQLLATAKRAAACSEVTWQLRLQSVKQAVDAFGEKFDAIAADTAALSAGVREYDGAFRNQKALFARETERIQREGAAVRETLKKRQTEAKAAEKKLKTAEHTRDTLAITLKALARDCETQLTVMQSAAKTQAEQKARAKEAHNRATAELTAEQQRSGQTELSVLCDTASALLAGDVDCELLRSVELRELREEVKWLEAEAQHMRVHPNVPFSEPKPASLAAALAPDTGAAKKRKTSSGAAARRRKGAAAAAAAATELDTATADVRASEAAAATKELRAVLERCRAAIKASDALPKGLDASKGAGVWSELPTPKPAFEEPTKAPVPSPTADDEELQPLTQSAEPSPPKAKPKAAAATKRPSVADNPLFRDTPLGAPAVAAASAPARPPKLSRDPSASEQSHDERGGISSFRGLAAKAPTKSRRPKGHAHERERAAKPIAPAPASADAKAKTAARNPALRSGAVGGGKKRRAPTAPEPAAKRARQTSRPQRPAKPSARPPPPPAAVLPARPDSPDSADSSSAAPHERLIRHRSFGKPLESQALKPAAAPGVDPFGFA